MVLFRIIRNLIRMALRLLWLPIMLLSRNVFLMLLLGTIAFVYYKYEKAAPPAQLAPAGAAMAPATTPEAQASNKRAPKPIVIDPVTKREQGDSAFATDLYALMDDDQRNYYSHYYYWAMSHVPDGKTQHWTNGNTHGSFTPTRTFTNNAGGTCRQFREMLKVRHIEQQLTGIACLKSDQTWCKLRPNATPACGLGGKRGFWETIGNWF